MATVVPDPVVYDDASRLPVQRIGILEDIELPSLKALHLSGTGLDPNANRADVIWYKHPRTVSALSRLTSLKLDTPMGRSHTHVLNILKSTPKLRKLHVALVDNYDTDGFYFTNSLLNSRIVPVLEELELDVATISRESIHGVITSRAGGAAMLRRLVVYGCIDVMDEAKYPAIPGVEVREELVMPGSPPATSFWDEWTLGLTMQRVARRGR